MHDLMKFKFLNMPQIYGHYYVFSDADIFLSITFNHALRDT